MRTDGRTEVMAKLVVAFRNFENGRKNDSGLIVRSIAAPWYLRLSY
jgi:hypothetical protein